MTLISIVISILAIISMGLFAFFCCVIRETEKRIGKKDERH